MISDIDEIPNPKKIEEFKIKNKFACFYKEFPIKKINLLNITNTDWPGTKIIGVEPITSGAEIRRSIQLKLPAQYNNLN